MTPNLDSNTKTVQKPKSTRNQNPSTSGINAAKSKPVKRKASKSDPIEISDSEVKAKKLKQTKLANLKKVGLF